MISGHVFIATSLDGFIARKNNELDWLPQEKVEDEDTGFEKFMDSVDGLVMGSGTFKTVLSFGDWPYTKPVVVLSNSLSQEDIPSELSGKVRISNLAPEEIVKELEKEGWMRTYVDGGLVVQSFIRAGLIEDIIVTIIPVLIGEGRSLFGSLEKDIQLKLIRSQAFGSGMVQNHYQIINN